MGLHCRPPDWRTTSEPIPYFPLADFLLILKIQAAPEAGFLPGAGLGQKLSITIGPGRATELPLTGNFISAGQGLIHFSD